MAVVSSIFIYPERDALGQSLRSVGISAEGLDDDRRKRAPVHIVSVATFVSEHPRANLVLDLGTEELYALVGRRLRIGGVELEVTTRAGTCSGVYADVAVPGSLAVGDRVTASTDA